MKNTMSCKIYVGSFEKEAFLNAAAEVNQKFYAQAITDDNTTVMISAKDSVSMQCAACILNCRLR